jgi:hypothetical protein
MERSWQKYRENQERLNRIGNRRRSRPDKGLDVQVMIIIAVIIIAGFTFLVSKGYI